MLVFDVPNMLINIMNGIIGLLVKVNPYQHILLKNFQLK